MSDFVAAQSHGELQEVFDDVFVVRGTMTYGGHDVIITRNMTVVRHDGALTVINSVRLDDKGEAALEALGTVEHLIKLSDFHGIDDPYYKHKYDCTVWAVAGARHKHTLQTDREYDESSEFPIAGASVFMFKTTRLPEAALILPQDGGILITADCVHNIVDTDGCSGVDRVYTREHGYLRRAGIGNQWLSSQTKEAGPPLVPDYQRLMQREFVHLISGHGPVLRDTAKQDLAATIRTVWGLRV